MGAIGGPLETVAIAGREFRCTADADVSRKLGGFEGEYQANGDGSARRIMTPIMWMLGGMTVEVDDDNGDQEFLESVKNSQDDVDIVATFVSGANYAGRGNINGELSYSNNSAAASFDLSGPGELKKL